MWLWILAAAAALLALLCLTRVGAYAAFGPEGLCLDVTAGLFRLHILPPKKKKKPKAGRPKKKRKKQAEEAPKGPGLTFTGEDAEDALRTLLPVLKRTLGRFRRGIRIRPLRLSVTLGGREDPAAAAQLYGQIQAAVWTGMPILEDLVDIPSPSIHTGVDFDARKTAVEGEAGVTFRIGALIAMGFGAAFPALRWFLRWRKRCKNRPPKPEARPAPEEPAA